MAENQTYAEAVLVRIYRTVKERQQPGLTRRRWSIRLPYDLFTQLSRAARKHTVTMTDIVIEALRLILPRLLVTNSLMTSAAVAVPEPETSDPKQRKDERVPPLVIPTSPPIRIDKNIHSYLCHVIQHHEMLKYIRENKERLKETCIDPGFHGILMQDVIGALEADVVS